MNKKSLKIPKVQSQAVNGRIDKAMAPKKGQTMIFKTLHRKLKTEIH
jgi:hypothetical protein